MAPLCATSSLTENSWSFCNLALQDRWRLRRQRSKATFPQELATEPLSSISVIGAHNGKPSLGILESSKKLRTAALGVRER